MELRPRQFYVFAAFFPLLLAASSALFLGLPITIVVAVGGFLSLMGLGALTYAILCEDEQNPTPLWYIGLLILCCINLFAFVAISQSPGSRSDLCSALQSSAMAYVGVGSPSLPQTITNILVSLIIIVKIIRTF